MFPFCCVRDYAEVGISGPFIHATAVEFRQVPSRFLVLAVKLSIKD
jgi:hypothetical protein